MQWETIEESGRKSLRNLVTELVGYPCKIACTANDGCVDLTVFNVKKSKIMDWLELQPSGAIGVIFSLYGDKGSTSKVVLRLSDACDDYNSKLGVAFESDSESDSGEEEESDSGEDEDEDDEEEEEEETKTKTKAKED